MSAAGTRPLSAMERRWVKVTRPPWCAAYLIPAGFVVFPVFDRTFGPAGPVWALAVILLGILFALRFAPAVLRRFLPVSATVKHEWFQARLLAKRHDSYQWQKLVWVGAGILLHAALSARTGPTPLALGVMCAGVGGLGAVRWRSKQRTASRHGGPTTVSRTA